MSTGKLTATVFMAGPEDKLGVVDVYEKASDSIVNSYQEQFHNVMDSLDGFLSGVSGFSKGLKGGLDFINSNLNAINGAINSAYGMVNGVIGKVMSAGMGALGSINGIIGSAQRAVSSTMGILNGIAQFPGRTISGILGAGGQLANGFLGTATRIDNLFNPNIDFRGVVAIGRVSDRLSGGLNNRYRNRTVTNQSTSLQDTLAASIVNYGSLNPLANNLSSAINNDLDVILGGDRGAITSITRPAIDRVGTLAEPSRYDKNNGTLTPSRLIDNITNNDLSSAVRDLTPEAQDILVRGLTEEKIFANNKVTVAGNAGTISPQVSEQNKEAIANIINTITGGNYEVKSKTDGADCTVIAGAVHLASKAGFPKPFETIAKHKSPELMIEIAKPLLRRAVEEGDFEMIRDIATTAVSKEIPVIVPNLIKEIKVRLKKPDNLSQQEYARFYKVVKGIFANINPTWTRYSSGKINAIDATGIALNPFFADLLEAQMNEMKNPELNLGNLQVAYPLDGLDNPTKLLNEIGLPDPIITTDESGNEVIIPPDRYVKPEVLKIDPKNYKDEAFMLLGKVFLNNTVDSEIKKHFPYFYETMETIPVMPMG